MALEELRLVVLVPDRSHPDSWEILVAKSPIPGTSGKLHSSSSQVTAAQLSWLRGRNNADRNQIEAIGAAVLQTLMPPALRALFDSYVLGLAPTDGVRLVVSVTGDALPGATVGANELPLEAIFDQGYLATSTRTPVSRGISGDADKSAVSVAPPLRILVVVSEPKGMPPVHGEVERAALTTALQDLVDSGTVTLEFCEGAQATMTGVDARLREGFHVVHFIGHGDFEIAGADPNPQPHLYFVDGTPAMSRQAAGVEQIFTLLRNGNVPLVVMTACSSAAEAPNAAKYPGLAFESLARALVERNTGPHAVVAMQFDLETDAAAAFSAAFYSRLLQRDTSLDAAVAYARSRMLFQTPWHRAWVNPTVYWRCRDGRLFDILNVRGELTQAQREALLNIETMRGVYEQELANMAQQPASLRPPDAFVQRYRDKLQELLDERGRVLGDTVRLRGGMVGANGEIDCALTMQVRTPTKVDQLQVAVAFDANEFEYRSFAQVAAGPQVFVSPGAGDVRVLVPTPSNGAQWPPGEHVLATIRFRNVAASARPLSYLRMQNASVKLENVEQTFPTLDAVVFSPPPTP